MKRSLVPALVAFAAAAVGLIAVRENMAPGGKKAEATTAVTEYAPSGAKGLTTRPTPPGSATLKQERDGHFWASARVNGAPVRFLVDTGASVIALTPRDARKAGLNPAKLPHIAEVSTASGRVKAGVTMLDSVKVGDVEVQNVEAVVIDDGLEDSLLGMNFLNRLDSWRVTDNGLVLRQ